MRILIALGGNALLRRGEAMAYETELATSEKLRAKFSHFAVLTKSSSLTVTALRSVLLPYSKKPLKRLRLTLWMPWEPNP